MPGPMDQIVVQGAMLKCSMSVGTPAPLKVTPRPAPPMPSTPPPPPPHGPAPRKQRRVRTPPPAPPGGTLGSKVACDMQRIATIWDFQPIVNVGPFGMCRSMANPQVASATAAAQGVLTPQPCVPVVNMGWNPGSPDMTIGNVPALTKTSKCLCNWAGIIEVATPGQKSTKDAMAKVPKYAAEKPGDDPWPWFRPDLNPKMRKSYWTRLQRKHNQRRVRFR